MSFKLVSFFYIYTTYDKYMVNYKQPKYDTNSRRS